jgi:hypothetical protein
MGVPGPRIHETRPRLEAEAATTLRGRGGHRPTDDSFSRPELLEKRLETLDGKFAISFLVALDDACVSSPSTTSTSPSRLIRSRRGAPSTTSPTRTRASRTAPATACSRGTRRARSSTPTPRMGAGGGVPGRLQLPRRDAEGPCRERTAPDTRGLGAAARHVRPGGHGGSQRAISPGELRVLYSPLVDDLMS